MSNRQRANKITLALLGVLIGIIMIIMTFPDYSIKAILGIIGIFTLYGMSKAVRNGIEEHLDEQDKI
jgi:uncharacterized PurR-regulated membrane protein YhhQ (DUF165 family)